MDGHMTELKPCPFCGGEARASVEPYRPHNEFDHVSCQECWARIDSQDSLEDAITAWNTRTGWQPIGTAPRDGTRVDLWCIDQDGGERLSDCWWGNDHWWGYDPIGEAETLDDLDWTPTHWRYPPAPPE